MTPEAVIGHAIPGRIRLKIPGMRGDPVYFQTAGEILQGAPGVRTVQTNHRTASILVTGPAAALPRLRKIGSDHDLFHVTDHAGSGTTEGGRRTRITARTAVQNRIAVILLALAFVQTLRGQIMVPALALIWNALELIQWENLEEGQRD
ncbi:MAG: hypothetical protein PVJ48_03855 [Gammaproteobacteria bacterium]|mgnify:FL=1|jgi:hypothetical protein|nr:MAG: hypothetical protein AMJ59_21380 [Gammaproteobacteria bacterium SG8_31]